MFSIGNIEIKRDELFVIAGPCVIESEEILFKTAEKLKEITQNLKIPLIFKSSYDKANRSSIKSYRGPGIKKGLEILNKVKEEFDLPILSDVHSVEEIQIAKDFLDVIQIPAFLCRQTDMIVEAGKTGKPVNVKKGQFLAPWDVKNIIEKIESTDNKKIIITERGTSFGYNNLIVDFRSFPIIRSMGVPVVFDATHSVQLPGGAGTCSSGQREFIPYLSRAAVACGVDGLFFEVHPEPDRALCDGPNMIPLKEFKELLKFLIEIHNTVKNLSSMNS
ncbi:MAG: 3-deoxy-8-phosphooctulonate synthase [Thermodesulfovibrio sp.]|jgi:2-dehydro-3-deoxyphosphooctonate aldolase (KDO 8-P synthase)|uniref:2-dehydro-3-deoxyphosphooctonate aldolase n=1 Tax=Thermodesulfovibrio obliviosus TaxID=3118332 RepID=A0AAU8H2J8_9BACT